MYGAMAGGGLDRRRGLQVACNMQGGEVKVVGLCKWGSGKTSSIPVAPLSDTSLRLGLFGTERQIFPMGRGQQDCCLLRGVDAFLLSMNRSSGDEPFSSWMIGWAVRAFGVANARRVSMI